MDEVAVKHKKLAYKSIYIHQSVRLARQLVVCKAPQARRYSRLYALRSISRQLDTNPLKRDLL